MKLHSLLSERPIAFYPALRKITGSITAAIMLQQLLYWWNRRTGNTVYKTIEEFEIETSLSRYEQDGAIKLLKKAGFISVERKGLPAKRHFKLDIQTINDALTSLLKTSNTDCCEPAHQFVEFPQTNTETTTETTTEISPPIIPPKGDGANAPHTHADNALSASAAQKPKKRRRGIRFEDSEHGGVVPDDWLDWAQAEGLTPPAARREAEKFSDYWAGVPGQRGVKLDWAATWRNWVRRAMETGSYQTKGEDDDDFESFMEHLQGIVDAAGEEGGDGCAVYDRGADAGPQIIEGGERGRRPHQSAGPSAPALPGQRRAGSD